MHMDFDMDGLPLIIARANDDGLSANQCYPQMLVNDPTFALLNEDNYFRRNGRTPYNFAVAPSQQLINGQVQPYHKRDVDEQDQLAWDDGNSSRPLTRPELEHFIDYLGWQKQQEEENKLVYIECIGDSCATEVKPLARCVKQCSQACNLLSEVNLLMLPGKHRYQSDCHPWYRLRRMPLPLPKPVSQANRLWILLQRRVGNG
jgi:hypothetical protein